jgi:hypothetical protein
MSAALPAGRGGIEGAVRGVPRGTAATALQEEALLALAYAGLVATVAALALAGAGALARPLYMLAGLAFAWAARRRSPWLYVTATLWFWLFTAGVRRVIDWHAGYSPLAAMLATPNLMAMRMLPDILSTRGLLRRPGIGDATLLAGCVLYGLFLSLAKGEIFGAALSATDWVVPLLYLFFFICEAGRIDDWPAHFKPFLAMSLALLVPYSLYQYVRMPPWDALWMVASGMASAGSPVPLGARVFGPLNAPGMLAIWCGACLVLLALYRSVVMLAFAPPLLLLVAVGQVRCVYGSVALALLAGGVIGRGRPGRLAAIVAVAAAGAALGAALLDPRVTDQVAARVATLRHLASDASARSRAELYAAIPDRIEQSPFGVGIAEQGRGLAAQGGREQSTLNIDSGPLSDLLALGLFAGVLHILAMALIQLRAIVLGRRLASPFAAGMAAASVVVFGTYPFLNVIGFPGAVFWMFVGAVLAMQTRRAMAPA